MIIAERFSRSEEPAEALAKAGVSKGEGACSEPAAMVRDADFVGSSP